MARPKNAEKGQFTSGASAVENGRKGGKASAEAKRRKKELRECMLELLNMDIKDKKGDTHTGAEAIALAQFNKALKGDKDAFILVRDTAGQKPIDRVQLAEVDQQTIDEVERIFNDEDASDK